jgi:hypothetical protein
VKGNTVVRNGLASGEGAGVGIFAADAGSQNYGNVVVDNYLAQNGLPGVTLHSHSPGQNVIGHLIANNTIYANGPDEESGTSEKAGIANHGGPGAGPIIGIRIVGNKISGEGIDVVFNAPGGIWRASEQLLRRRRRLRTSAWVRSDATLNWWKCSHGPAAWLRLDRRCERASRAMARAARRN